MVIDNKNKVITLKNGMILTSTKSDDESWKKLITFAKLNDETCETCETECVTEKE